MKSIINELWHGNIIPQEDSRTNSPQMKELLGYMARHHEELEKSFTDEQKEIFEKFHDCWDEYVSLAEAPSSNTPSASERGSQWRCRRTKNSNKTANQASVKYPMPSCLAHIKVKEKKRLELFTVL